MSPLPKLNFEYGGIGGNVPCRHPRELVFCRATFVINLILPTGGMGRFDSAYMFQLPETFVVLLQFQGFYLSVSCESSPISV